MNQTTRTKVESLFGDFDFRSHVTRAEFEELCADLFNQVLTPIDDVLKAANMTYVRVW